MCLPLKPFKIEREWEHAGLTCAVVQGCEGQHRCGYVRVPPNHPLHSMGYEEPNVEVHGGLTFAELEPCTEHPDGQGWWFGFDCAHFMDASYDPNFDPTQATTQEARKRIAFNLELNEKYPLHLSNEGEHYWTQAEVEAETERLAEQLALATE